MWRKAFWRDAIGQLSRWCYTIYIATTVNYQYLEQRPKSAYRALFVKGTKIQADWLYRYHINLEMPRSAEVLAADFNLPLAAVQEAIEYGRSNPPEVAEDMRREEALMEAMGMNDPDYKHNPRPRLLSAEELARLTSR